MQCEDKQTSIEFLNKQILAYVKKKNPHSYIRNYKGKECVVICKHADFFAGSGVNAKVYEETVDDALNVLSSLPCKFRKM